jgi:DNA-binding SARP family transcriptional activator
MLHPHEATSGAAEQDGLSVGLMGPPFLRLRAQPVRVDTRKAIALLAYLLVEGGEQPRDSLAAMLWPESNRQRSLGALRRTLTALRSAGASPWLRIDRNSVGCLARPDLWVDTHEFGRLLRATGSHGHSAAGLCPQCRPILQQAIELWRGDFLAGFSLADSPAFDDWQLLQQESLRRQYAGSLHKLVRLTADAGEYPSAIELARQWLQLDPLNEPAHRALMRLHANTGQRSLALRQYRDCVRVLEEELGVPPLEATTALYDAIQAGELAAERPEPELRLAPQMAPAVPMLGRRTELGVLHQALGAVVDTAQLLILQGESGVGKTRLAEVFAESARAAQSTVLQGRCFPEEGQLAYAPILEALRQALRDGLGPRLQEVDSIWLSETARLLPELLTAFPDLPQPAALADPAGRSRLFEGVHQVMGHLLGAARPGVLLLDDFHWADRASREWLGYVLRRGAGSRMLALVTWRVDGPQDLEQVQTWAGSLPPERVQVLPLGRLGLDDLRDLGILLEKAGRGPRASPEELFRETEGLPLLLGEYLAQAPDRPIGQAPSRVQELFVRRISAVGQKSQQLLGAGAVIGRSFGLELLRQSSGRSEEEVVDGLEELLTAGLVTEQPADPEPVYDFTHERLRAVALNGLTQARRRLLHRRVAEALQAQGGQPAGAAQIARHLAAAGQEAQAAEYYRLAGEHARELHANADAQEHLSSALALGHPEPGMLHEALGDLHTLQGSYREAAHHYEAALAFLAGQAPARLEQKLGSLFQRWGQWPQAEAQYSSALSHLAEADLGALARLYADWSLAAHRQGDPTKARQLLGKGLRAAEAAGDDLALAQCTNMLGILERADAQPGRARQHLERSLGLARRLGDAGAQIAALNNLALVEADLEDLTAARGHADEALALCERLGDRHREAALHSNLADLLHQAGQHEEALSHLKRSATLFAEVGVQEGEYQPEIWKLVEW